MPPEGAFLHQSPPDPDGDAETPAIGAKLHHWPTGGAGDAEMHPRDRAVVAIAGRQHGVVTTAQAEAAGVDRRALARRAARGWLVRCHQGVYRVAPLTARYGREMAAVLAIGEGAVLSHQSAAAIWGLMRAPNGDVHVSVARRGRRSRPGIRVHQTLSIEAAVHSGLPLTTPARTLKDLARTLTSDEVERAREQAHILGLVIPDGADRYPEFTRSEAERRLKRLCKAAQLPMPRTNTRVNGYEVDAFWPAHRLIVEVDGYRYHRTRQAFERDRRKDAALQVAGYRVVRITWSRLTSEPYSVSAQLGALLAHAMRPGPMAG
jgi:very-short-patch-repair endonuclease